MEIPDITGVHGMNKSELISVIKEHRGIKEEKSAKAIDTRAIKRRIAELKEQKERLREAGDKDKADFLRRKISRLKKKTRRAA
jgi:FtsZ-binding cell division protein ZapB